MTTVTLTRPPHSYVPSRTATSGQPMRLSHLDPRPLWLEPVVAESPWRSFGFCAACAIVLPIAAIFRVFRVLA